MGDDPRQLWPVLQPLPVLPTHPDGRRPSEHCGRKSCEKYKKNTAAVFTESTFSPLLPLVSGVPTDKVQRCLHAASGTPWDTIFDLLTSLYHKERGGGLVAHVVSRKNHVASFRRVESLIPSILFLFLMELRNFELTRDEASPTMLSFFINRVTNPTDGSATREVNPRREAQESNPQQRLFCF